MWQGWAVLAHLLTALPPSFFQHYSNSSFSLSARLGPLSKAPSSWEQAGIKCLSPSVIEVATHRVSSVTTQAGLCQGQNEFVGRIEVMVVVGYGEGIYHNEWWITWRCADTSPKRWRDLRWNDARVVEEGARPGSCWLFYLFIVALLKRWWRSGCASALQLCTVCELDQWTKYTISVKNAADVISASPAWSFFHTAYFFLFLPRLLSSLSL